MKKLKFIVSYVRLIAYFYVIFILSLLNDTNIQYKRIQISMYLHKNNSPVKER